MANNPTLSTYQTQVQRLLHDSSAQFWTLSELTDYINEGRNRIVSDTGCLRQYETVNFTQNGETYPIPAGVVRVIGMTYLWGNWNEPMIEKSFSFIERTYRTTGTFTGLPVVYARQGQLIYIEPIPNQAFVSTWDCIVAPATMVNLTDAETIPYPYFDAVKFYAAYLAALKQAEQGSADYFLQKYQLYISSSANSRTVSRRSING